MAQTSTYGELIRDGVALRRRLESVDPSVDSVESVVRELRRWQTRCATAVAVRNPKLAAEWRSQTGPLQQVMGKTWLPTPGWRGDLGHSLARWLGAIELASHHRPDVPSVGPPPQTRRQQWDRESGTGFSSAVREGRPKPSGAYGPGRRTRTGLGRDRFGAEL